ncbi:MAG: N-acetylmuramoyl-L-alanine amidase [Lentimicrobium sp.]|jgi:N-acetylmuramoyl-L-alanine amidase|nr:N-acetylmuramoyl-L-alanine amidase [Lentimicrobium sp.]
MRNITHIVVHCSATPQTTTIESIKSYWKNVRGWKSPGYHFIIKANGEVVQLLDIGSVSNGVGGRNSTLINICYLGGVNASKVPIDNRTPQQKASLLTLLGEMKRKFPRAIIQGHRDFPGVAKACPSFNAKAEYANL